MLRRELMEDSTPADICAACGAPLPKDHDGSLCGHCVTRPAELLDAGPWVPPGFWETDEMRETLASWHIGQVIAAYRHHPFHGQPLSQETVGRWVNITQAQLSRLENGPPTKDLDKLWLWARVLRIPEHLLWFRLPGQAQPSPRSTPPLVEAPADQNGRPAGVVAIPFGVFAPPWSPQRSAVAAPPEAQVHLSDGTTVPTAGALPPSVLANALLTTLQQYVVTDNLVGPRSLLGVVTQQLAFIEHLLADSDGQRQADLLFVAARFAEFAGWLYQDAGDLRTALQWSAAALEFARDTDDDALVSYIWMRKSNIGSDMGQPQLALAYARAALRGASKLPPRIRAVALRQAANGHALNGDLDACTRALDQALTSAAKGDDNDETDLARYCTPSYVDMEAAHCWVELGRPERAVTALQEGLRRWHADFRRDLGLGLARLAVAHAASGNPEGAVRVAQRSMAIAHDTLSSRTLTGLARVPGFLVACGAEESAAQVRHMLNPFH